MFTGNHVIYAIINVLNPLFVIQNVAFSCCLSRPSSVLQRQFLSLGTLRSGTLCESSLYLGLTKEWSWIRYKVNLKRRKESRERGKGREGGMEGRRDGGGRSKL